MAHREVHEDEQEYNGELETADEFRRRRVLERFLLGGELCAGRGAGGAFLPVKLGFCAVTGIFNGFDDLCLGCGSVDGHGIREKRYTHGFHAGHICDGLFNMSLARGTAHACDNILFHIFIYTSLRQNRGCGFAECAAGVPAERFCRLA